MNLVFHERHHYNTYYFSNVVSNVLEDPMPYLRNLEDFYGDLNAQYYLLPFQKWSALHQFIDFIIEHLFYEADRPNDGELNENKNLWLEHAFKQHGVPFESFANYYKKITYDIEPEDAFSDWYAETILVDFREKLQEKITRDVFSVLFSNRRILLHLNELIAGYVKDCVINNEKMIPYVTAEGVAKRQRVPQWAARAVFYRDRGRCCICQRDLSGLLSPQFSRHIDHIVPLAKGGINDVTNLQLLCEPCNIAKSDGRGLTSNIYEAWYDDRK